MTAKPQARGPSSPIPIARRWLHRLKAARYHRFTERCAGGFAISGIGCGRDFASTNSITRRWARRGTRPSAPRDQRYASAYIFGAVCPLEGKGAALVLLFCNTAAMNLHLAETSGMVSLGKQAVLMLDQAGWRLSGKVTVPANITLLALPPKYPELNVMENIRQFMRDNWLSNRVFCNHDDIVDHCCHEWNRLSSQPLRIMSIELRTWTHGY